MIISGKLFLLGLFVGFVSGMFGKGGSAIATPLLQLMGIAPFAAVASPLPATIPGTLVASLAYIKSGIHDKKVVGWSIIVGLPATIIGAWLSRYVGGAPLLLASNLILLILGVSLIVPHRPEAGRQGELAHSPPNVSVLVNIAVAGAVGFVSGILANSGGFLLAPLYHKVLKLPLKSAFACSLLVSAALAIPGTLVHLYLGHIDWKVVASFGLGSVPLSYLGAKVAIATPAHRLATLFGFMLILIGVWGALDSLGIRF